MKDLYINLNQRKKSRKRTIFGAIEILFAFFFLDYLIFFEKMNWFYNFYFFFFLLSGMIHFFEGLGKPVEDFIGKSFIRISDDRLEVKLKKLQEGFSVSWNQIQSLKVGVIKVEIIDRNNKNYTIDLSHLSYPNVLEVKEVLTTRSNKLHKIEAQ
ncbi:MAG TPA: hypothetical protein VKA34_06905 [Balneolales bacterium]|nr:hypothetical protein [Balneolales bacterium]